MTAEPPLYESVVDQSGIATMPWTLFFQSVANGDNGTDWTPTMQNLTEAGGAATIAGRYYQITKNIVFFRVVVTPVTSTTASATAPNQTYIDNFPLVVNNDGMVVAVAGEAGVGVALGVADSSTGRIYTGAWTSASVPVTVLGLVEAS